MPTKKKKKLSEMMDKTVVYGDKFGDIGGSAADRIRRGGSGLTTAKPDPRKMGNRGRARGR